MKYDDGPWEVAYTQWSGHSWSYVLTDNKGSSAGSKFTGFSTEEEMRKDIKTRLEELNGHELTRARRQLELAGISGIYDEFQDIPDAISQMAMRIKELEEREYNP